MTRTLTAAMDTAATSSQIDGAAYFVDLDFSSGNVRAWTGIGTVTNPADSNSYTGVGELGSISVIEEAEGVVATGIQLRLDVTDSSLLSTALTEDYQGRDAIVYLGLLDSDLAIIEDPVQIFGGVIDNMDVIDNGSSGSIVVRCESYLRRLDRAEEKRRTDMDQQERFPGDKGNEFVAKIQDVDVNWGGPDAAQTKQTRKRLKKKNKKN